VVKEDVGWFEIEMEDLQFVHGVHCVGKRVDELCCDGWRRKFTVKSFSEGFPGHVFEDECEEIGSFFDAVEPNEIGVSHAGCDGDFGLPAISQVIALDGVYRDEFEGDFAACGDFECEPDDGGGAGSEGFEESAAGDFVT
jgi:hypothetical protein